MPRILLPLIAAALVLSACGGNDSDTIQVVNDPGALDSVAVSGVGEVLGAPDTMTVTVGVRVTRDTVSDALRIAAERGNDVVEALETNGVERSDIQTANFAVYPEYDYSGRSRELIGFTVSNSVVARIRDVDSAGAVIDAAAAAGGDETIIDGIGFSVEDDAARLEEARTRAWQAAEAKAQQLADLAGVELGSVVRVSESVQSVGFRDFGFGADVEESAAFDIGIEPGEVTSTVVLNVVFGIGG